MTYSVWLEIAGLFLILEIFTTNFIFLSFSLAGLIGVIVKSLAANAILQVLLAATFSVLSLLFLRPPALKYLYRKGSESQSWLEKMPGSEAVALSEITATSGEVKLHGETWSARTELHAASIAKGDHLLVKRIEGAVAIVSEKHTHSPDQHSPDQHKGDTP